MENLVKSIFVDMENVSDNANPNNYKTEGKVTLRKFVDTCYPDYTLDEVYNFSEFFEIRDKYSFEEFEKLYNSNELLNFWVYDRYNDGSFIVYTIYGDKNSDFETIEILVDEIYDL